MKTSSLSRLVHVELSIPDYYEESNESGHLGKDLVPFLSKYMPNLQTLILWRPNDFPWTSSMFLSSK